MFERSRDKEWHNSSGTSSDGWGDPLEESCLGVGNSKKQKKKNSPSAINNHSLFDVLTAYSSPRERQRERERICKGLWIDTKRHRPPPPAWQYSLNANKSYLPNPSARAGYDTRSIFKRSLTGLNSEFSFSSTSCLTKAEEPSLPYYLPIAGGRIIGFIPFPRVLVLCEMQSVSFRIWTRVAVSISYDDNHYTTGTSECKLMITDRLVNRLLFQNSLIFIYLNSWYRGGGVMSSC